MHSPFLISTPAIVCSVAMCTHVLFCRLFKGESGWAQRVATFSIKTVLKSDIFVWELQYELKIAPGVAIFQPFLANPLVTITFEEYPSRNCDAPKRHTNTVEEGYIPHCVWRVVKFTVFFVLALAIQPMVDVKDECSPIT